jgi:hypothetical protein
MFSPLSHPFMHFVITLTSSFPNGKPHLLLQTSPAIHIDSQSNCPLSPASQQRPIIATVPETFHCRWPFPLTLETGIDVEMIARITARLLFAFLVRGGICNLPAKLDSNITARTNKRIGIGHTEKTIISLWGNIAHWVVIRWNFVVKLN